LQALIAVLKINFKKLEGAVEKIENREFAIQDSNTKYDIDLITDWDMCFFPGQRVEMSIYFDECMNHTHSGCPKCYEDCSCAFKSDVEW
jgi:hypothetical protein